MSHLQESGTHAAATAKLLHFLSFLGDVKSLEEPDSPDSAMIMSAFALSKSTTVYSKYVKIGYVEESGRREKSVNRSGAWW